MTLAEAKAMAMNLRTILWEPMTDRIYAEHDSFAEALNGRYHICDSDFFEIKNNTLWIALND